MQKLLTAFCHDSTFRKPWCWERSHHVPGSRASVSSRVTWALMRKLQLRSVGAANEMLAYEEWGRPHRPRAKKKTEAMGMAHFPKASCLIRYVFHKKYHFLQFRTWHGMSVSASE